MTWTRLSDNWDVRVDAADLSPEAERFAVRAMVYCNRAENDGYLNRNGIKSVGSYFDQHRSLLDELVERFGWVLDEQGGGVQIPWDDQESSAAIERRRKNNRERQRKFQAKGQKMREERDRKADPDASVTPTPVPYRPVPQGKGKGREESSTSGAAIASPPASLRVTAPDSGIDPSSNSSVVNIISAQKETPDEKIGYFTALKRLDGFYDYNKSRKESYFYVEQYREEKESVMCIDMTRFDDYADSGELTDKQYEVIGNILKRILHRAALLVGDKLKEEGYVYKLRWMGGSGAYEFTLNKSIAPEHEIYMDYGFDVATDQYVEQSKNPVDEDTYNTRWPVPSW